MRRRDYTGLQVLRMEFGGAVALAVMHRPHGNVSDRKASDLAPSLSSATGSANCGLHVMVKQVRDRQFEYLNAQQEALENKNGDE